MSSRSAALAAIFLLLLHFSNAFADDQPPMTLGEANRLPTPDILPASDNAVKAMQLFRLPEGFQASLWAAEPMLANPVAIQFDEHGRLFVSETYRYGTSVLDIRGYMQMLEDDLASRTLEDRINVIRRHFGEEGLHDLAIEGEVLRLLEDTDGDGVADKSSIYADGFRSALDGIAAGSLSRNGKVWFTSIPSLWLFTGRDHAETRAELSRGYGVRFGYTGHDLHGLAWGPDGKLYFSIGDRGAEAMAIDGSRVSTADTGAVFRCNPDGSQLEIVHRGLRNPQDLLFTENGDLFTGDNDSDQGDQERLVQIVEGGDSGWRIGYQFAPRGNAGPWNAERMWWPRHENQPAFMLPPICNVEDGPSGVAYYPGTGLAPGYDGTIFIAHFKGSIASSGIQTYHLEQEGASYRVNDSKPFLSGALPTDVKFGPDGRLYYSDWVEAWPKSRRGRIYAMYHPDHVNDPLARETQQLINKGMQDRSDAELARLLGHVDRRVRLEAQFTLAERGATSVDVFEAVAVTKDAPPLARLHAIWGLGQLAGAGIADALGRVPNLLQDGDPEVRAQAARVLGDHRRTGVVPALVDQLRDANARARFFAAQSLGKLSDPAAAPALIEALRANDDRDAYLRHAMVMGLAGTNNKEVLSRAAMDRSRSVRLGVLLAYRRLGDADLAKFLHDTDRFLVAEAARAINDEPVPAAMPALAGLLDEPVTDEPVMLRALNAAFRLGRSEDAHALASIAARTDLPGAWRVEALTHLAHWPSPPARDRIVGIFRPIENAAHDPAEAREALGAVFATLLHQGTPTEVRKAAFAAVKSLELRSAADALAGAVGNPALPGTTRGAALIALDHFDDPRVSELLETAAGSADPDLSRAALPIAARRSPGQVAPAIASIAERGSVEDQRTAFSILADFDHPDADRILVGLIDRLQAGAIQPGAQLELLEAAERRHSPTVEARLARYREALADSGDPLSPYTFALAGGDRWRGRTVFRSHPVMACQRCHLVQGQGGEAGPDLSLVGTRMTPHELLEAVIKPNASIADGYETIVLTLKSGEVVAGTLARETPDIVVLRLPDGAEKQVTTSAIARRDTAPSSMPEIFGAVLSREELRDLMAYLQSLKQAPVVNSGPRALKKQPAVDPSSGHGEG